MQHRRQGRSSERRYTGVPNVRHSVAVEAARLLYTRECKEYFQAKRLAARRLSTKVLPTNSEIHQQLLLLAERLEGDDRSRRLLEMRRVALEMMTLLSQFEPRLIGSTWTGHIRHGSDIDLNLYSDSLQAVTSCLDQAAIPFQLERVSSRKHGQERDFLHLHVHHPSGQSVEVTLYPREQLKVHPTCSITGGPMPRGSLAQLQQVLSVMDVAQAPTVPECSRSAMLYPLHQQTIFDDLPELLACSAGVHDHTMAVVRILHGDLDSGFDRFEPWSRALRHHFQRPGQPGWSRASVLILGGLCHHLGTAGQEPVSERLARAVCQRWGLPTAVTERVARIVAMQTDPIACASQHAAPSRLFEMLESAADLAPELLLLSLARVQAESGSATSAPRFEEQMVFVQEMLAEYFEGGFLRFPNMPVSAVDLEIELGLRQDSLRRELLHALTCLYVDGEFQGREDGLVLAAEMLESPAWKGRG